MSKKLFCLSITFICICSTVFNSFSANIATISTPKHTIKQVEEATERIHERDKKEYERQQADIAKRLNSLTSSLEEMRNKLIAMEVSSCSNDTCSAIVTIDGIAIENNKDNWRFRYYIKDKEFQTIKLKFKYDFVSDYNKLVDSMNKKTAEYVRDSYKRYNAKGELY